MRRKSKRIFKKVYKFYENPKPEEVWDFHDSFYKFMIPRLELFKRDSDTIVDWCWHKENDNIDVLAIIDSIIADFKYVQDNLYCFDDKVAKECIKRNSRALKNLNKIFFYLWI